MRKPPPGKVSTPAEGEWSAQVGAGPTIHTWGAVWVKLDDGFSRHPKILGIPDPALRLHLDAMCYAAQYLTDGEVRLESLLGPKPAQVSALVEARLWVPNGPGSYTLHDWADYQPRASDVVKRRAHDRERLRRWRERNGG